MALDIYSSHIYVPAKHQWLWWLKCWAKAYILQWSLGSLSMLSVFCTKRLNLPAGLLPVGALLHKYGMQRGFVSPKQWPPPPQTYSTLLFPIRMNNILPFTWKKVKGHVWESHWYRCQICDLPLGILQGKMLNSSSLGPFYFFWSWGTTKVVDSYFQLLLAWFPGSSKSAGFWTCGLIQQDDSYFDWVTYHRII